MKCYEKDYDDDPDKKIKAISCDDSQYCENDQFSAHCGNFESFFIPYDYCVTTHEYHRMEVRYVYLILFILFTNQVGSLMEISIHENTYSISSVSVSVEKIVVTIRL